MKLNDFYQENKKIIHYTFICDSWDYGIIRMAGNL